MGKFLEELFRTGIYKRSQGQVARKVTFVAVAIGVSLGCWRLNIFLGASSPAYRLGIPGVLAAIGLWISYRLVNFPEFADFLISVEAEMNKVSWPSRGELFRSSLVVIFVIFFLAGVLFGFDLALRQFFVAIGVVKESTN